MEKLKKRMSGFGWAVLVNLLFLILNIQLSGVLPSNGGFVLVSFSVIGIFLYMYFCRQSPTAIGPLLLNASRKIWIFQFAGCLLVQMTCCIPYLIYWKIGGKAPQPEVVFHSISYNLPADILYGRFFWMLMTTVIVYRIFFFLVGYFPRRLGSMAPLAAATSTGDSTTTTS
jgi:hypothetical protein